MPVLAGLATLAVLAGCEREPPPAPPERVRQDFHLNCYEKDFGYSQAVLIDKTLYVSGSVAADADGRLVAPNDMAGQMRAVYASIKRTLAANGVGFDSVVKETIYTTDMDALLKVADMRFEYYSKGAPARRLLGAGAAAPRPGLPGGGRGRRRAALAVGAGPRCWYPWRHDA